ncbi:MAG TPA: ABC transporter permease [Opitutaceae bacterium]|nr:ABC transporter permease [Opitutaceae bacterium]
MLHLALKMLFGDRAKYLMLVSGITFSTLLMTQFPSVFAGIMSWTYANLINSRAPIWVMDPKAEQSLDNKPLRDTDVNRVRSVEGVAWAAPYFHGSMQARMPDGNFRLISLVGLDATTLAGAPTHILEGKLEDLRLPNTVFTDEFGLERFSENQVNADGSPRRIGVGDTIEINDREARIVGVAHTRRSFTGGPFVITTYDRAVLYAPQQRKMLSFILAAPQPGVSAEEVVQRIQKETGLKAMTEEQFRWSTIWWYVRNTGIPYAVGSIVIIGALVGMVIAAQTFYAFVLENLRNFAALKAMGASNARVTSMLIVQALATGFIGYGLGVGIASLVLRYFVRLGKIGVYTPWQLPVAVFVIILGISSASALLGIIRVARTEPSVVFR